MFLIFVPVPLSAPSALPLLFPSKGSQAAQQRLPLFFAAKSGAKPSPLSIYKFIQFMA
jgi:hypothetical protein